MTNEHSVLFVPVMSNAHTLLTGAPVAALRNRLKFASIFFDRIALQAGILKRWAGPGGGARSVDVIEEAPRWQTPSQRGVLLRTHLKAWASVLPPGLDPLKEAVVWIATLEPFANELPRDCDWMSFVPLRDLNWDERAVLNQLTVKYEESAALKKAFPNPYVRTAIIRDTDTDLLIGEADGFSTAIDSYHLQVVKQRFADDDDWRFRGYAVPFLFPQIAGWSWDDIANLRRDRNIARFRKVLQQVEEEAVTEAAGGDVEAAAHHAYERHLAEALGRLQGVKSVAWTAVKGLVIGGAAGFATSGITGPAGVAASTVLGSVPTTIIDVRKMITERRTHGWLAVHQKISGIK